MKKIPAVVRRSIDVPCLSKQLYIKSYPITVACARGIKDTSIPILISIIVVTVIDGAVVSYFIYSFFF